MNAGDYMIDKLVLSSKEYGPIACKPAIVPKKIPQLFAGGEADTVSLEASGAFGSLLFHEMKDNFYSIRQNNFMPRAGITLCTQIDVQSLAFHYTLKNDIQYTIKGFPTGVIRRNEYNMVYVPKVDWEYHFQNADYACFGIHCTPEYLQGWNESFHFDLMEAFLANVEHSVPSLIHHEHSMASPKMRGIIRDILQCQFRGSVKRRYIESRVSELLIWSLQHMVKNFDKAGPDITLLEDDIEKIHAVKDIIVAQPYLDFSIRKMAQMVGTNEFKLKKGFKKIFKTTVFDFILDQRMERARMLLLDSDKSVNEIATITGYKNVSNFSTAFARHFGCPPSLLKRRPF